MSFQDEIIVLKEVQYKDYDKILQCFSKKNGKIQVMARNARRANNENMSIAQIMNHSQVNIYLNKDMYILTNGSVINHFYEMRNNFESYVYGSYVLEILNHVLQENENYSKVFDMSVKILQMLEKHPDKMDYFIAAYEIKLISILGYKPELDTCSHCGGNDQAFIFSIDGGGIVCNKCKTLESGLSVTPDDIAAIRNLIGSKFENITSLNKISSRALFIINAYFNHYIGKDNFKSLKLIR
jgi:DNA repair protein RecO (recombination protein O)